MALDQKHCIPCEGGTPPLTKDEIAPLLKEIPGWQVINDKAIEKEFKHKNFKQALEFINKVGDIAESENHHPDILLHNWNKVKISLSTHALKALSQNDFILAAKINKLLPWMSKS